jgi:hypothetical protein
MGKNKPAKKISPEDQIKENGNKAFAAGKFKEAIDFYTEAINLSNGQNCVFFSNRANAYLELRKN